MRGDDAVDLDAADAADTADAADDLDPADASGAGEAGRPPRRRAAPLVTAVALVAVLATGVVAHRTGAAHPAPATATSTTAAPTTATLQPHALQRAVAAALGAATPPARVRWGTGAETVAVAPAGAAAVDDQREGLVTGSHVAYRLVTGLPPGTAAHPCLLPTVRIASWQYDQGGDASLLCRPEPGRGPGAWAVREGRASLPSPGTTIAVREVVLARGTLVSAVATWSIGPRAQPLLSAAQLGRVAAALAAAARSGPA